MLDALIKKREGGKHRRKRQEGKITVRIYEEIIRLMINTSQNQINKTPKL